MSEPDATLLELSHFLELQPEHSGALIDISQSGTWELPNTDVREIDGYLQANAKRLLTDRYLSK